jgi:hypothetical protein
MLIQNQINKTYSMSFAEYLYNSIQANSTFFLLSDWGFFVNIEKNGNTNSRIANQNIKNNKIRSLATIKENSIKSFQSMSNLHDYEYNDIVVVRQDKLKQKDEDYKFCIFNGQIITNAISTISAIKNNLYFLGALVLYNIGFTFHTKYSSQV